MNWVTQDEALDMYARYWATRHGEVASEKARRRADALQAKGDKEGYGVWRTVADKIDRKRATKQVMSSA
ncbi:MAG: hypothetical protein ACR2K5_11045 [Pseudolabrys sp.]